MQFTSLEYAIFFTIAFLVFWALARFGAGRIVFLTFVSWAFYAAGRPEGLLLLLVTTCNDYWIGRALHADRLQEEQTGRATRVGYRRFILGLSLLVNLGVLGFFKYSNFFYELGVGLGNTFGANWVFEKLPILLPAGLSFYTFQSLSYTIDVYKKQLAAEANFFRYALFVGFFPSLLSGPILRARNFLPQLNKEPFYTRLQASRALWLILMGLCKKLLVADVLANDVVDRVFNDPNLVSSLDVMMGLYAYSMQTYMDFSGYSDIAIGCALLLGYRIPDNFDRPYAATSIQDFWRRWHKTLGEWMRVYVYFPLGGGKGSTARVYTNLFLTFVLIGFWHGANLNFLLYGIGHATAMCVHRAIRKAREKKGGPRNAEFGAWGWMWRVFLTFHFVVFMRILFRAGEPPAGSEQAWATAQEVTLRLFDGSWGTLTVLDLKLGLILAITYVIHLLPRHPVEACYRAFSRLHPAIQGMIFVAVILVLTQLAAGRPRPFGYMHF